MNEVLAREKGFVPLNMQEGLTPALVSDDIITPIRGGDQTAIFKLATLAHASREVAVRQYANIMSKVLQREFDAYNGVDINKISNILRTEEVSSLDSLLEIVNSGDSVHIKVMDSFTVFEQIKVEDGQTVIIELNDDVVLSGEGNVGGNGRLFQIDNGVLTLSGGKVVAPASSYGAFRVEKGGVLNLYNTVLENSKKNGLNVKVIGGRAVLDNVEVNSTIGGAIEVTSVDIDDKYSTNPDDIGYAEIINCRFNQQTYGDWCSTCLSVSGGAKLVVRSGEFISENWALYVFSSGGEIEIYDGVFEGKRNGSEAIRAEIDTNTYQGFIGGFKIHGGTFKGTATIITPAYMVVDGGTFDNSVADYLKDGYKEVQTDSGLYMVVKE